MEGFEHGVGGEVEVVTEDEVRAVALCGLGDGAGGYEGGDRDVE